jgi:hypothetical protein
LASEAVTPGGKCRGLQRGQHQLATVARTTGNRAIECLANDARVGVTRKCHGRSTFRVTLRHVIRVHLQLRHLDSIQARLQHRLTMAKFDGAHEKRGSLMTACAQPGCTGRIVDRYCDVCGSPAAAAPFVPAGSAASAASPAPADEPGLTAVPASTPAPAPVYEEIPTQRIPRVKMPRQQLSTQDRADPGAADPGAVDAQQVDGEKVGPAADDTEKADGGMELAEGEPDGAQDYRTRVEETQLPDDVRKTALCEVGKLERSSDQSPESSDIRTWLDTILDLPWSTKTTDWIDIQGSREVEATLRRLIEPAIADLEEGDTAEVEPAIANLEEGDTAEVEPAIADLEEGDTAEVEEVAADLEEGDTAEVEEVAADLEEGDTAEVEEVAADLEEADTAEVEEVAADLEEADIAEVEEVAADVEEADIAPGGPQHDDTVKMPAVLGGGRHQRPPLPEQRPPLPEQPVLGPEPVQTPAKKRRESLVLAATALALLISALLFAPSGDRGVTAQSVPTVTATTTATVTKPTNEPSNESAGDGRKEPTLQLEDLPDPARPFQTVRVKGTYRGGPDTFLQVQRWEGGEWLAFPLPTKTDNSGQFTAFVEFGQPGRYWLRVVDPNSGVTSNTFALVITG